MTTEFIEDGIWSRLTKAAKACRGPAVVAVAYFSEEAAALLPIPKGSQLVVDASEATVKCGLTCPADLLRLHKKGVRIFSVQNLHAKVYVFGAQAFIGSANASNSSATRLKEAMLRTTERDAVKAARAFVRELCSDVVKFQCHLRSSSNMTPIFSNAGKHRQARMKGCNKPPHFLTRVRLLRRDTSWNSISIVRDGLSAGASSGRIECS